jgi:hypothetical protein
MTEPNVKRAEEEVRRSTAEFERSMDHLEEAMEDASQKVSNTIETVHETIDRPKRIFHEYLNRTKDGITQGRVVASRLYQNAQNSAQPLLTRVREDRRIQMGLGALVLSIAGLVLYRRRKSRIELTTDQDIASTVDVTPVLVRRVEVIEGDRAA